MISLLVVSLLLVVVVDGDDGCSELLRRPTPPSCVRLEAAIGNQVPDPDTPKNVRLGLRWNIAFDESASQGVDCGNVQRCTSEHMLTPEHRGEWQMCFRGQRVHSALPTVGDAQCLPSIENTDFDLLLTEAPQEYALEVWIAPKDLPGLRSFYVKLTLVCVEGWYISYCYVGDDAPAGPVNADAHSFALPLPFYVINLPHTNDERGRRARTRYSFQLRELSQHAAVLPVRVRAMLVGEPGTACAGKMRGPEAVSAHRIDRREAAITCTFIQALRDIGTAMDSLAILCEDDVELHPEFYRELTTLLREVPADFDVLHLGARGVLELPSDDENMTCAAVAGADCRRRVAGMPWPRYGAGHAQFSSGTPLYPGQPTCGLFTRSGARRVAVALQKVLHSMVVENAGKYPPIDVLLGMLYDADHPINHTEDKLRAFVALNPQLAWAADALARASTRLS